MDMIVKSGFYSAVFFAIAFPVAATDNLILENNPNSAYQLAASQFLPEVEESELGFSGRTLKGNYNKGKISNKGCGEDSPKPCSDTQLTDKTYRAPNGRMCYVCRAGDGRDCRNFGFRLQSDWNKPVGNWDFVVTATCPYDSNYVKGDWQLSTCSLPDCVSLTTKPENSSFISATCTDCNGTRTINVKWQCNDGYLEANGSCLKKSCAVKTCSSEYFHSSSSSCPKGKGLGSASCTPVNADCTTGKTKYKCTCTPYKENGVWVQCAVR